MVAPRDPGAGVLGRPPRRPLLHPDQRQGPQQPPGHGAGRRPRPRELEGGRAAPRRRDARRLRPVPRLDGPATSAQDALPRIQRLERVRRRRLPDRLPGGRSTAVGPQNNREFDTGDAPHRVRVLHDASVGLRLRHGHAASASSSSSSEVLGGYDPSRYTSERRYATASDGTKVPISIVYRKGFVADGKAPAAADGLRLLRRLERRRLRLDRSSASSTAASSTPSATSAAAATSARSGTTQGKMLKKKNTFTDFIAVRRDARRRQVHVEGPPRHRGRHRRRAAHGRRGEHAARPLQGRRRARAVRRRDQHDATTSRCR